MMFISRIDAPTCKECGSFMVPKDGRYTCVNCGAVGDCLVPEVPPPCVVRNREVVMPEPKLDAYVQHVEMTPAEIREYWRTHAPQAKRQRKAKR